LSINTLLLRDYFSSWACKSFFSSKTGISYVLFYVNFEFINLFDFADSKLCGSICVLFNYTAAAASGGLRDAFKRALDDEMR